ncbi:pentatricopeptide repeat-containing protein At5g16860-like [Selaginella moellendorffii]|uniref:pentatricopeptide repeat-containing protein At5g16860-like n=1 Tax=Selaginella moellendorffii TaxID=88036 RepID=UPI000D1C3E12|nr:pentatricopeptide repeat-containing protein At5g16860-like [Selaginella moellendorffii]|eukprot:XP_024530255.1 pentatricopeptide repeat-containing protein At5g16860-like [Selaginella moellendorffii]
MTSDASRVRGLVAALKACANEQRGRVVHGDAARTGDDSGLRVANALLSMYARCGCATMAHTTFDAMPRHTSASWNLLMLAYAQSGHPDVALRLLLHRIIPADRVTFLIALKACSSRAQGLAIHRHARDMRLDSEARVATALITMYSKHGSLLEARQVFDRVRHPDVVLWTCMMLCYADNHEQGMALELLGMIDCAPDSSALVVALKASSGLAAKQSDQQQRCLAICMAIHASSGPLLANSLLASSLVDAYAKCGSLCDAERAFDSIPAASHTVYTWTSLMSAYTHNGEEQSALAVLAAMTCPPNAHTLAAALKAVAEMAVQEQGQLLDGVHNVIKLTSLERGMWIHKLLLEAVAAPGLDSSSHVFVANSLVAMYARCGSLLDATRVFEQMRCRNIVSWTCLMSGLVDAGDEESALQLLARMRCQDVELEPNAHTLVAALKAVTGLASKRAGSSNIALLETGMALEQYVRCSALGCNPRLANSLVLMYIKCGALGDAARVWRRALLEHGKDDHLLLPALTSLVSGYTEAGQPLVALTLLFSWQLATLDAGALAVALEAAAGAAALDAGRQIHAQVCRLGLLEGGASSRRRLETCVVDLYAKCGCMLRCELLFESLASPLGAATLNALLSGLSRQGNPESLALWLRQMAEEGVVADATTLTCLLAACSRAGLVDTGKYYFDRAGVKPQIEHYHCLVDMLGRANRVEEALEVVEAMATQGVEPNAVTWTTLLAACTTSSTFAASAQVAKRAFDELVAVEGDDTKNAAAYVMMSGICARES